MLVLSGDQIELAADLLKKGELVAFPTETVYGLGAPIFNEKAIAKIFQAKGRPANNPLIAHIADLSQVDQIARDIPPDFYRLAAEFFPGPLTIVLKKHPDVPAMVSGGLGTIALRMPSHPLARRLILAVGEPLVAPSANLSGTPSSTTARHVIADFQGKIAAVIDGGETEFGIESTVIYLASDTPCLLRPGALSPEAIEKVLGKPLQKASSENRLTSPGMQYRHYSPQAKIRLFTNREEMENYRLSEGRRLCLSTQEEPGFYHLKASNLYALLRLADEENYPEIVIFCDETRDLAFLDRLQRASLCK